MPETQNRHYRLPEDSDVDWRDVVGDLARDVDADVASLAIGGSGRRLALHHLSATDIEADIIASTWTTIDEVLNFQVVSATSNLEFAVAGAIALRRPASNVNGDCGSRLLIDAGTPSQKILRVGGAYKNEATTGSTYSNPLSGSSIVLLQNLAIGAHTLQLQVWHAEAATIVFQAASRPSIYFCEINVWEC